MDALAHVNIFFLDVITGRTISPIAIDIDVKQHHKHVSFTLPGLYELLAINTLCDYHTFRRQLYQSTLNESLSHHGYRIVIESPSDSVDTTWYTLSPLIPHD